MKNILVIGGSYFIGKVFVLELLNKEGYSIHVLNRGNNPFERPEVTEYFCDRHNIADMKRVVPPLEWHAVVDFCAFVPDDVSSMINNLPGTIEQYIYISTTTVYEISDDFPKFENSPKLSGPLPGPFGDYGYNKWLTEIELVKQCEVKNIPYTILRPAFVYGQFNYAPRESYFFDLILENNPVPFPEDSMSLFQFVFVRDVAALCIACLGSNKVYNNTYNLSAEELISYRKLMKVLEEVSGTVITRKNYTVKEIDQNNIPLGFPLDQHELYSGSLIACTLNFQYTPFAKGMKEAFEFYKKYCFRPSC